MFTTANRRYFPELSGCTCVLVEGADSRVAVIDKVFLKGIQVNTEHINVCVNCN